MGTRIGKKVFIPIGVSCITQFQLNKIFGEVFYESMLFDWNITTPDGTFKILNDFNQFAQDGVDDLSVNINSTVYNEKYHFWYWHIKKQLGGGIDK